VAIGANASVGTGSEGAIAIGGDDTPGGAARVGEGAWESIALGAAASVEDGSAGAIAIGTGAIADGVQGVAIGHRAAVTADRSMALGSLSVADRDRSISVGFAGFERQITNVAAGTVDTDAVNLGQMNFAIGLGVLGSANHIAGWMGGGASVSGGGN